MIITRVRRRKKTRRKKINIKEKKKHEVTAIHWFLGQRDWNGLLLPSMCIVIVSICPSVSLLSLSLCCQSNQNLQQSFRSRLFSPIPFLPSVSLCHVFHIWECQCATCWHCAWMITCLYIVLENRIPFPWCCQQNGSNVQILVFCSSFILFDYILSFFQMCVDLKTICF